MLTGRRSAMYGDVTDYAVPQYVAVWRSITDGHWPWWTPGVFGGQSAVGAGQPAVFYPLNAVFGVLEPVTAYRWWLLAHLWIGTAGAFLWAWHRFGSRAGAIVAGVAYTGSGFAVLHLVHPPFVITVAWLPWALLGLDLVRERWSLRRAALAAGAVALIGLGGHPQMLWIALLGAGVYTAVTAAVDRDRGGLLRVGAATALGLGLAAVQLLPLWLFSRTSARPSLSVDEAFELSARPRDLLTLVFPWLYGGSTQGSVFSEPWHGGEIHHEVGMFAGAAIVALAVYALVTRRRLPAVRALAVLGVVGVVIALGGSTPLGRVVYEVVPLASGFRAWARLSLLVNVALAGLAAAGVAHLVGDGMREGDEPGSAPPGERGASASRAAGALPVVGVVAGVAAVVALGVPHLSSLRDSLPGGSYALIARGLPVVALIALLAAVAVLALHPRAGAVAVVAVCLLEVLGFVYAAEWRGLSFPVDQLEAAYDEDVPPSFGSPHDAGGGVDRWVSSSYGFRMLSLVKDLHGVNGYDSLLQEEWAETAAGFVYDGYPTRPDFWEPGWLADVLRVTTLVAARDIVPGDPSWRRVRDVADFDTVRWDREPRLPEAYLVGAATVAPLPEIRQGLGSPDSPLSTTAYVEPGDASDDSRVERLDRPGRAGRVLSADVLGSGRVVVDATRPGLLVLSHTWSDGWTATVDGDGAEVLRTNGLVLGVVVPEGRHEVEVRFRPPGLRVGASIGVLSVLGLLVGGPAADRVRRAVAQRRRGESVSAGATGGADPTRSGAAPP